jgi:hypothetical protein
MFLLGVVWRSERGMRDEGLEQYHCVAWAVQVLAHFACMYKARLLRLCLGLLLLLQLASLSLGFFVCGLMQQQIMQGLHVCILSCC